jgi:hypothetical protein
MNAVPESEPRQPLAVANDTRVPHLHLQAMLAQLTLQQLVELPHQLNDSHPSKHAQSALFEAAHASASKSQAIDSRVVLACFGEVVSFQRIFVDIAGGFVEGVVLSQLLDCVRDAHAHNDTTTNISVKYAHFLELTARKTGLPQESTEAALQALGSKHQLIVLDNSPSCVAHARISMDANQLVKRLKQVVSAQTLVGAFQ